jgi:hypothetical protein
MVGGIIPLLRAASFRFDGRLEQESAIEYGYAMGKLSDSAVLGVFNKAFGEFTDLPFDIIHKRWPIHYTLVEGATDAEIDVQREKLRSQFIIALRAFIDSPQTEATPFEETPERVRGRFFFHKEHLGHCNQLGGQVEMVHPHLLYMRLIPTKDLVRPMAEKTMLQMCYQYGAMGSQELTIPITNSYGAMCFSPVNGTRHVDAMTQYFANGEIWAINSDILRHGDRSDNEYWYNLNQTENAFMLTLERGFDYLRNIAQVEMPVKVSAGVVGIKGRRVVVSGSAIGQHGKMMKDEVHLTRIFHDDSIEAQDKFLLELFNKIFDQSGAPRPPGINGFPKRTHPAFTR